MDAELLTLTKRAEIEREIASIRLTAAAAKANSRHDSQASPQPEPQAVPPIPLRLLRALRLAS